jgi:hypothetical protein
MGNAGPAIAFMLVFVASIMVGICVLAYAARCVLVVVQETAVGHDEVVWPKEPYVDWLGHAVQFLELVGIWLAPAALTARLLRETWLPDDGALRVLFLTIPGLWLFFPIGLLSSLSAQSNWVPFRWTIFRCFLRVPIAALRFYILSALVLGVALVPWYYGLFGGEGVLLLAAAPLSAAGLLIYSRLLGRIAWIIQRLPSTQQTPAKAKAEKQQPKRKKKRKPSRPVQDPWAVPDDEERERKMRKKYPWAKERKSQGQAPSAEEIEGYGLASEQPGAPQPPPEKPPRSRFARSPEEYEPYEMRSAAESEPAKPSELQSELFAEQVRQEIAQRTRTEPPAPKHPFVSGVYNFPLYSASLPQWLALSLAFAVEGGLVSLLIGLGEALFQGRG